eukprot:1770229-Pyramimonas_sp.AAC.1
MQTQMRQQRRRRHLGVPSSVETDHESGCSLEHHRASASAWPSGHAGLRLHAHGPWLALDLPQEEVPRP